LSLKLPCAELGRPRRIVPALAPSSIGPIRPRGDRALLSRVGWLTCRRAPSKRCGARRNRLGPRGASARIGGAGRRARARPDGRKTAVLVGPRPSAPVLWKIRDGDAAPFTLAARIAHPSGSSGLPKAPSTAAAGFAVAPVRVAARAGVRFRCRPGRRGDPRAWRTLDVRNLPSRLLPSLTPAESSGRPPNASWCDC